MPFQSCSKNPLYTKLCPQNLVETPLFNEANEANGLSLTTTISLTTTTTTMDRSQYQIEYGIVRRQKEKTNKVMAEEKLEKKRARNRLHMQISRLEQARQKTPNKVPARSRLEYCPPLPMSSGVSVVTVNVIIRQHRLSHPSRFRVPLFLQCIIARRILPPASQWSSSGFNSEFSGSSITRKSICLFENGELFDKCGGDDDGSSWPSITSTSIQQFGNDDNGGGSCSSDDGSPTGRCAWIFEWECTLVVDELQLWKRVSIGELWLSVDELQLWYQRTDVSVDEL